MGFKDQLETDFEKVFLNKDEFADTVIVDGVEVFGIFESKSNGYNDTPMEYVRLSSATVLSDLSKISIGEKTYGVISVEDKNGGEKIVFLGDVL